MTLGISAAFAASRLNIYRGTANPGVSTLFVQLHTGDPGAAGTANVSTVGSRKQATYAAPAAGANTMDLSAALAAWSMTGTETITHYSYWDALSGGTFYESGKFTGSGVPVIAGSSLQVTSLPVTESTLAA